MDSIQNIKVPDIGDFKDIVVVEIYINAGDQIKQGDPVISLESDKALMDIPSPFEGIIKKIIVSEGDKVSEGDIIAEIELSEENISADENTVETSEKDAVSETNDSASEEMVSEDKTKISSDISTFSTGIKAESNNQSVSKISDIKSSDIFHATPSVRRLARELGVDLSLIVASGPKGRILKEDLYKTVSSVFKKTGLSDNQDIRNFSAEDFIKFGVTDEIKLSRIKQLTGENVYKSWRSIPQVTHFDEADAADLEQFRKDISIEQNIRLSMLPFIIKAAVNALEHYPVFNSTLNIQDNSIILKKYYNIGIAVNTERGLVVPVIKNADRKNILEINDELKDLVSKAREGKLDFSDTEGSSFSISSLGSIGGTGFTPIVNISEAAILGVSKTQIKAVWNGEKFIPSSILPFSVSYDHRIIDGAQCAEFSRYLGVLISDIRKIIL